jgi:uncharacterized protein (TIGR02246 family)
MRTSLVSLVAIAAAFGLAACQQDGAGNMAARNGASNADTAAAGDAVKKVEQEMLAAWKAKDAAKVASYYADDAVTAMPSMKAAKGHEAVAQGIAGDVKDPAFSVDFANEATDIAASGDLAYTRGTFRVGYTDPATKKARTQTGNYLTVFRKQADGSWKAVADYATDDGGAGGAKPPTG